VAAHLGIDVPWSQGLPLTDLVSTDVTHGPRGAVDLDVVGSDTAFRRFRDDRAHRSEIVLGDKVVSTGTAWSAEAPVAASGDRGDALCWRELELERPRNAGTSEIYAWTAHCRIRPRGGAWTDVGFATPDVGPGFAPSMAWNGDRLEVAWYATPTDAASPSPTLMGLSHSSWQADGTPQGRWQPPEPLAPDGNDGVTSQVVARARGSSTPEVVVARAAALEPTAPAVSRGIQVINLAARTTSNLRFDELWRTHPRVEHPSLHAQGESLWLAAVGMDDGYRGVALTQSADAGRTWSPALRVIGDPPLVHLAPRWSQNDLVYAGRAPDGTASVCRVSPGSAARCVSTGFERLDSFAVQGNSILVSVDTGVGNWEIRTLGD
jgi:hypothetical protein